MIELKHEEDFRKETGTTGIEPYSKYLENYYEWLQKKYTELKAIQVQAKVKPESTDIEKQENIVKILYDFLDNMIIDGVEDHKKGYYTGAIGRNVGTALEKLLAMQGLKTIRVD